MRYISTRGAAPPADFEAATLDGLAPDGGLYLPETIPALSPGAIAGLATLSYSELAARLMARFTEDSVSEAELLPLTRDAYAHFDRPDIAPLTPLGNNEYLLELFHGPTLAFKDFALQFLGPLFDHFLHKRGARICILGATSGDTGSAAIAGCGGRESMDLFILYPQGRVSEVQRRQMTTVGDNNVHTLAIEGNFDDCQTIVKTLFGDAAFRERVKLAAINSINWARILAQIVYYFHAALALGAPSKPVSFSVPTGNFGDIYAGYVARAMGLPVRQLIIASNRNDILTRCVKTGVYGMTGVAPSLSPSMDIGVSSNFERLLFDLYGRDGDAIAGLMQEFRSTGSITLAPAALGRLREIFSAACIDDDATLATIAEIYKTSGHIVDPHTAVGIAAGRQCRADASTPLVMLATAHPAKFPDSVERAIHVRPPLPRHLDDLLIREERTTILPNDAVRVKDYIEKQLRL